MQEAGTSINIQFYRDDGASIQATIREPFNPESPEEADQECFRRAAAVIMQMKEKGWLIVPGTPRKAVQDAVNGNAHQQHASGGGNNVFTATKLIVERDKNDNKVGKLKGGQFLKFGVRLWPEAAADMGINLDIPVGEHEIEPINVRYIVNEKGDPTKVIGYA